MLTALLLALIGSADIVRTHLRGRAVPITVAVLWVVLVIGAGIGLGAPLVGLLVVTAVAALWLPTTTTSDTRRPPAGTRPMVGLVAVVVGLTAAGWSAAEPAGPAVRWFREAAPQLLADRPVEQVLLATGAALFLVESGNVVVRAALHRDLDEPMTAPKPEREPLRRRLFARPVETGVQRPDLRGGRAIGPLERLLVAGLTLAGAIGLAGAVFAAKGIVRFPEISRDGDSGTKAEYFLVGSLVSWTVALACAALVALAG